jgi:hypothetical protein
LCPETGFSNRTDGLGFGYRPEWLGSVWSIITSRARLRKKYKGWTTLKPEKNAANKHPFYMPGK